MKKVALLFCILVASFAVFAQKAKVTTALSYKESGDLVKAAKTIEETIDTVADAKALKSYYWPRTWEVRGEIYAEVHKKGVKGIVDEPLFVAFDSYMKALEMDPAGKNAKLMRVKFTFLQTDVSNYAVQAFEKGQFSTSLSCFEKYMQITNLPIMKTNVSDEIIDTAIVYNAGLAAFKAENWEKAVYYLNKSIDNGYNGGPSYYYVFKAYQSQGDTLSSLNTLKKGFENYPDNETLLVELINFYMSREKAEDAITYIDKAISENPVNSSYWVAKGSMCERLGKPEDAIEMYKKAIEIDSAQFTPYYNLSVIYYNRGVEAINSANLIPPSQNDKFEAEMEKAKEHFRLSLPYIEKAYELDQAEIAIMESLRTIYYRLQMTDKYNEMNEKIKKLKQ